MNDIQVWYNSIEEPCCENCKHYKNKEYHCGFVRMKDVEEAQQKIVNTIRRLEDAAEIVISRGGGDDIVV